MSSGSLTTLGLYSVAIRARLIVGTFWPSGCDPFVGRGVADLAQELADAVAARDEARRERDEWVARFEKALGICNAAGASRDIAVDALRRGLSFLTDAIEESGDDEETLVAEESGTVWTRTICARDVLRAALVELNPDRKDEANAVVDVVPRRSARGYDADADDSRPAELNPDGLSEPSEVAADALGASRSAHSDSGGSLSPSSEVAAWPDAIQVAEGVWEPDK